eukprot:919779-Pyramimonas_sp.AAC.1
MHTVFPPTCSRSSEPVAPPFRLWVERIKGAWCYPGAVGTAPAPPPPAPVPAPSAPGSAPRWPPPS